MNKALLLTALVSATAFSQETSPPPSPPPVEATPPAPVRPPDAPMMEDPGGRVRWGVSGNFGWHIPSPAFTLGAEGRIGYQITNMFGAYAVVGGTAGIGFGVTTSISGANVSITALSYWYLGAIAELLLADIFYVGGGFVGASGAYVGASVGADSGGSAQVSSIVSAGLKPGLDIRMGLALGRKQGPPSFRKGGFNLGLDALVLFHPNAVITTFTADAMGNAGAGVTTNGLAVSVVPMLMLGYDAR